MSIRLFALLLAALPALAHAADPFAAARATTLPNGLTVLLAPDSTAASIGLGIWVRAGSRIEPAGATGMTHLIERLMFMGTTRNGPGEYTRRVQAEGGTFGAFTTADETCFESTLPPAALETLLRLEADRFGGLLVTKPKLDLARRTVRDERRGRADQTAVGRVLRLLYATAYPGHPYRLPATGLEEDLDRITLAQVQAYRAARYVPGRMVVALAGRFEPAAALAAVKRTLGALPGKPAAVERPAPQPTPGERRARMTGEASAAVMAIGWRSPGLADPDAPAMEVLGRVLTGGSTSRVQRLLIDAEHAPCQFAQGSLDTRAEGGLLYLLASPTPLLDTTRAEREVVAAIEAAAREPVSDDELEAAKRQVEVDLLFAWQTPVGVERALGTSWIAGGDPHGPAARLERVRALTAADVQRVAARVLVPERRAVVWILPTARPQEGHR